MKNHCKANPCCGEVPCEGVPLPQHRSGLWFHNSEEYRRKADQENTPSPQPRAELVAIEPEDEETMRQQKIKERRINNREGYGD